MTTSFSPSINITRDAEKDFSYIPTLNGKQIFQQIINNYKTGLRSFNIIGSYGTGKSAFLLAFEKNLRGERQYFDSVNGQFGDVKGFECWNIVGEHASLLTTMQESPQLSKYRQKSQSIWDAIDVYYADVQQKDACLLIAIDEFGKFLEFAASHNPEEEIYFIQQLAEYANDDEKNILLLTTLHQGFDSYARGLDLNQRQEWEKVKGRLKELSFNEPVELLLKLAAEYLASHYKQEKANDEISEIVITINKFHAFPHRNTLDVELAQKLEPFDPLVGAVLTLSLQRYGQNERSLFTFLQAEDRFGLYDYDKERNPFYNLACLYDYLSHNQHSFLSTKHNPHYGQWASIRRAIERVEARFELDIEEAIALVKTIGLLNIFASENARIDKDFLIAYAQLCLGIDFPEEIIQELEHFKIILYRAFKQKFVLFEGTNLDFELALLDAGKYVNAVNDVVTPLKRYFEFPYPLAKAVSYQQGTPRFFRFELSETQNDMTPRGEIDGIINLIFSESISPEELQQHSAGQEEAIIYGLYRNTKQIRDMLFEIAKTEHVIAKNKDDRVAVEELTKLKTHQVEELNHYVLHHLHRGGDDIVWIFHGEIRKVTSLSQFNTMLSEICRQIYRDAPVFRNEMVNRHKLSAAISTARRNYIRALTTNWLKVDLGFPTKKFPAEKTIYLALLKATGIHRQAEDGYELHEPEEGSFGSLWQACDEFLNSAKFSRKNIHELVNRLSEKPLKLKQGLIDFWLPTFLFIKREDFALYQDGNYVPEMNHEVLELIVKKPEEFFIKRFDVQGVKLDLFRRYRQLIQKSEGEAFTNTSFIETVRPFLTFYHALPVYTKHTQQLSQEVRQLRDIIANASDPEKTFFEDFPHALGYGTIDLKEFDDERLESFTFQLRESIKELQTCFSNLIGRIEERLLEMLGYVEIPFPDYRLEIRHRFASLKEHLLLPHIKGFYSRLLSDFGDKEAWIASIVQALLHKRLIELHDEEEELIYERLSHAIQELDNLCEISELIADPEKEKVVKVEVTSYAEGSQERLVRVPIVSEQQGYNLEEEIGTTLSKTEDRRVRISVLLKLLQQEIQHENG